MSEESQEFPGPTEFVHLHNHTLFSMLDGVASPDEYFAGCVERGWPAFGITEHGVMSSMPDAYLAAKKHGIKYIPGVEFYYNDYELKRQELMSQKGFKLADLRAENEEYAMRLSRNRHLTVLCKNRQGYENMLTINKRAYEEGFYYKPRMWFDMLAKHKEGLIVLSGCMNGPICHELRHGHLDSENGVTGAIDYIKKFRQVFGDDFYIELQMPGIEGEVKVFRQLVAVAETMKIKAIVTNDCHYMSREDFELQRLMMAIDQNTTVSDPNLFHVNSDEQFFKTRADLRKTFATRGFEDHVPRSVFEAACDNTLEIAEKSETFQPNLDPKLPNVENAREVLCRLALQGLKRKGLDKDKTVYLMDGREVTYRQQMEIELQRFVEKGFASYFLITRELIQESYRNGWPLGPARGSAGGSLVCFLLDIQSLDPIKWGTSFNRFLSPARGGNMLRVTME